jgi:hypothetical protein
MAIYGLSVFLETRRDLRRGRHVYILISFAITFLYAFGSSLDAFWAFKLLFDSTSPRDYFRVVDKNIASWERWASSCSVTASMFIGDSLLVSP